MASAVGMKELFGMTWFMGRVSILLKRESLEVEVGATPKRRTVRKFAVRGVDMDQLLDMGTDELVKLFTARAHRSQRVALFHYAASILFLILAIVICNAKLR
ncbi:hypothetical protein IFM89_014426 [Coptis chinensis]|uniref:Uncharacterized protein n=1 Tax=Coptis chinensis TaxID=261450 RepID=A0A835LY24_9MAGN|nr:hypothetical protein IFM89_014426 [Coptis chinensis]